MVVAFPPPPPPLMFTHDSPVRTPVLAPTSLSLPLDSCGRGRPKRQAWNGRHGMGYTLTDAPQSGTTHISALALTAPGVQKVNRSNVWVCTCEETHGPYTSVQSSTRLIYHTWNVITYRKQGAISQSQDVCADTRWNKLGTRWATEQLAQNLEGRPINSRFSIHQKLHQRFPT